MRRIGRSYNNAEYFISQSTKDALKEEDNGNFGVAFAFDEPNEREDVLKWMNMEVTKENLKMMESMFQGQCLFKDYYGRTAKISIECLFEEWEGALKTVEKKLSHTPRKNIYKGDGKMEVALLNSLVLTSPGCYKADKITIQEVHDVLGCYGWRYKSFIGHRSTALFMQALLGIRVEHNRKIFRHMRYQKQFVLNCMIVFLNGRC